MGTTTVAALAAVLIAAPAHAAADVDLSISPVRVIVTPDSGATQVVQISGDRDADIVISFDATPPGFSGAAATRRGEPCNRVGGSEWLCKGFGNVTLTYPAVPETAKDASYKLTASADGRRTTGWVDVPGGPEPSKTSGPPAEPDNPKPASGSNPATATTTTATRVPTTKPATTTPPPTRALPDGFGAVIGVAARDLIEAAMGG